MAAANRVTAFFGVAVAFFAGVQLYREVQEKKRAALERQDKRRRQWKDLYGTCQKKRDEISLLIDVERPRASLDALPLAMAREFEARNCVGPGKIKAEDQTFCALLQEFRRLGRSLMAEVEPENPSKDTKLLQKRGYNEAVNILLPTMALDAVNAKAILKSKGPLKEPQATEKGSVKELQVTDFGQILLLLLLVKDEVNLHVLRDAKRTHGNLPEGVKLALDRGDEHLKTLPPHSKAAQLLRAFIEESRK